MPMARSRADNAWRASSRVTALRIVWVAMACTIARVFFIRWESSRFSVAWTSSARRRAIPTCTRSATFRANAISSGAQVRGAGLLTKSRPTVRPRSRTGTLSMARMPSAVNGSASAAVRMSLPTSATARVSPRSMPAPMLP